MARSRATDASCSRRGTGGRESDTERGEATVADIGRNDASTDVQRPFLHFASCVSARRDRPAFERGSFLSTVLKIVALEVASQQAPQGSTMVSVSR